MLELLEFQFKVRRAIFQDKALVSGGDEDAEVSPLQQDNKVAALYIHPPQRQVNALCKLVNYSDNHNLLEDPISLCIVGGLQSKIQHFCSEHGKSHGASKRYYLGLFGLFFAISSICYTPLFFLRMRDEYSPKYHIFFSLGLAFLASEFAERSHRTSIRFLESKRQFWQSWSDSVLESELSSLLGRCGYYFEIEEEDHGWKLSLYKKPGEIASLPPPQGDEPANESAKKLWDIFERAGTFERRRHLSQVTHNTSSIILLTNDDPPRNPLDIWTIRGIFLGRSISSHMNFKATQIFGAVIFFSLSLVLVTIVQRLMFLWFLFVYFVGIILCIILIGIFGDLVDMPRFRLANEKFCTSLSPLIQNRHGGHTLVYEIKPISKKGFSGICCFWKKKRGVFVLEGPETMEVVDC